MGAQQRASLAQGHRRRGVPPGAVPLRAVGAALRPEAAADPGSLERRGAAAAIVSDRSRSQPDRVCEAAPARSWRSNDQHHQRPARSPGSVLDAPRGDEGRPGYHNQLADRAFLRPLVSQGGGAARPLAFNAVPIARVLRQLGQTRRALARPGADGAVRVRDGIGRVCLAGPASAPDRVGPARVRALARPASSIRLALRPGAKVPGGVHPSGPPRAQPIPGGRHRVGRTRYDLATQPTTREGPHRHRRTGALTGTGTLQQKARVPCRKALWINELSTGTLGRLARALWGAWHGHFGAQPDS